MQEGIFVSRNRKMIKLANVEMDKDLENVAFYFSKIERC